MTDATATTTTTTTEKTWWPTRKWIAAQITTVTALVVAWLNAGEWNKTMSVALVGLISQALITYVVANQDTPGGVPVKQVKST